TPNRLRSPHHGGSRRKRILRSRSCVQPFRRRSVSSGNSPKGANKCRHFVPPRASALRQRFLSVPVLGGRSPRTTRTFPVPESQTGTVADNSKAAGERECLVLRRQPGSRTDSQQRSRDWSSGLPLHRETCHPSS